MEHTTFGNSPASLYMVEMINNHPNSKIVGRKVGRVYSTFTSAMQGIHTAQTHGLMTARDGNAIVEALWNTTSAKLEVADIGDEHIKNLLRNVLSGMVSSYRRRAAKAARHSRIAQRASGDNCPFTPLNATDYDDTITSDLLKARSADYLARHDKINTLY